jgi:arsenate reductase
MAKSEKTRVLFVCYANMIRSQMAEGFARDMGAAFLDVHSAGIRPTGIVSEEAKLVMAEKNIDISAQRSKGLSDVPASEMDYIVNMSGYSADDAVPAGFGGTVVEWRVEDPVGKPIDYFRSARDTIEEKTRDFVRRLWNESPATEGG